MKMRLGLVLCAVFALTVGVAAATAAPQGSGAATPFKATYIDNSFGSIDTCSGAHVVTGNGAVKDSETCILSGDTSLVTPGTYVGPVYNFPLAPQWVEWASDFNGAIATAVTLTIVANGDGTFTEYVVAYY